MTADVDHTVLVAEHPASLLARLLVPFGLTLLLGVFWFARFNPITGFTPGTDSGAYLYIGQQLLKGAAPYRDVFDNKGPLLYLLNALGLVLGAGSFWGVYALEYFLLAATTVLAFVLLKTRTGRLAAALTTLFFVLEVAHIAGGDHEEEYAVVLQCLALFLLFRKPLSESRFLLWLVVGLLGTCAFFLKPTGVGLWAALLITALFICLRRREWRKWLKRLAAALAGAVAGSISFVVYLSAAGALHAFAADFFRFNFMYVGTTSFVDHLSSVRYGAGVISYPAAVAVLAAWLLTLHRVVRRGKRAGDEMFALLAIVWLPVEIVLAATSGYARTQYYFSWLLPSALLLAFGLVELGRFGEHVPASGRHSLRWGTALLTVVAFAGLLVPTVTLLHDLGGILLHYRTYASQKPQAEQIAAYVDTHTTPSEKVLVWGGYDATVNFLAMRDSPTRYVMQLALYYNGYAVTAVPEFLRELEANPPALILDTSPSYGAKWGTAVPPLAATSNPWAASPARVAVAWAAVYAYIRGHYRSAGKLDFAPGWPVYIPR